jgi:glycosyltransferase involved in cell wall biosynthesis
LKIVYFYQYFTTPKGSYGTRVYEFTKRWVELGHEVTVVTSVYAKSDIRATKFIEDQEYDGIKLKVINVGVDNRQGVLKRIWTFVQYMVISCWFALTLKADVVIASSGPITTGVPGLLAHYVRRRKFVFEVRDLWPEVAVVLGVINNKTLVRLSYWFEKQCYKAASHIIALSPGMMDDIKQRYGFTHITSVTNSANIQLFSTPAENPDLRGLKPKKYAIYTGNIGMVNNSEWLYRAAKLLKERGRDDIMIVLVGEGQWRKSLEQKKNADNTDNFVILASMPKKELVALVQNALVSLVPLKGERILDTSSPNKFFESLAAGVPVIQNTGGWMKDFLDQHQVGYTLDPDDETALADLLIEISDKPELMATMGERAKKIAAEQFDKDILAEKMLNAIIGSL